MSDKAAKVIAEAVRDHLGFHDCPTDENDCCADTILAALRAAGIALVDGFTEEWGEPWPTFTAVISERTARERQRNRAVVVSRLVGPWREVTE